MAEIRLDGVRKTFGKVIAVKDIDLTIEDGGFLVLLGPSGCGKTTTLRCIAGLERVDQGQVYIGDRDVSGLPPAKRGIAMVFQSYAVFPNMTVFKNIAFGLKMQHVPKTQIKESVHEVAELLQIEELLDRYPAQLSGGQRQRVAVARAIVLKPEVLLMDEPLSNLDALLRLQMRAELKRLHKEVKATTVYVTHDQVEALSLGERIAVMKDGEIVQHDIPLRVYNEPANVFVGGFIGTPPMNFLRAQVQINQDNTLLNVGDFQIKSPKPLEPTLQERANREVIVGVRAENIEVELEPTPDGVRSQVLVVEPLGAQQLLTVQVGKDILKVATRADVAIKPDQGIWLKFSQDKIRVFDEDTGGTLSSDGG